jgi:hypothetical protein
MAWVKLVVSSFFFLSFGVVLELDSFFFGALVCGVGLGYSFTIIFFFLFFFFLAS